MSTTRLVSTLNLRMLQESVDTALNDARFQVIASLVERKLNETGVSLDSTDKENLLKQLRENSSSIAFQVNSGESGHAVEISFTDQDTQWAEAALQRVQASLPTLLVEISRDSAESILTDLKRRWKKESRLQRAEVRTFQKRLYERWRKPLELTRQYLTMSAEFGASVRAKVASDSGCGRVEELLTRLYARALRVAEEIFSLLRSGYADGALVRWRTLHEITVVSRFVALNGEETAVRYFDHQAMKVRSAMTYVRVYGDEDEVGTEATARIDKEYAKMLQAYGNEFRHDYGWASKALNSPKPNFRDLEFAVKAEHYRPHYQWASQGLHAGSKGTYAPLTTKSTVLLVGPSNTGLSDPGQATVRVLTLIAEELANLEPNLDTTIIMLMLRSLSEEIEMSFLACHQKLEDDEAEANRL